MDNEGLLYKYDVKKAGTDEVVTDCFVLRPETDAAARFALKAYAAYAKNSGNYQLYEDIQRWLHNIMRDELYRRPELHPDS